MIERLLMRVDSLLFSLSLLMLHFSPIKIGGFPLTVAPFVVLYLARKTNVLNHYGALRIGVFFLFLALILCNLLLSLATVEYSVDKFLRTASLWVFYVFFLLAFLRFRVFGDIDLEFFSEALKLLIYMLFGIVVLQYLLYAATGDVNVFTPFGKFSYGGQGYLRRAIEFGVMKAPALYLEPAFLSLVVFSSSVALYVLNRYSALLLLLSFLIVYLSGSASGQVAMLVLAGLQYSKLESYIKIGVSGRVIFFIVSLVVGFVFFGEYLTSRYLEFESQSSSSYYRIIAPLNVLYDILLTKPTGIVMGQMEQLLAGYDLQNGDSLGASIDNGWYVYVMYFGWFSVFILFFLFFVCMSLFKNKYVSDKAPALLLFITLSPFFTGAVFSPEYLVLQLLVIISLQIRNAYDFNRNGLFQ